MQFKELPLRTGVGIIVLNNENKVFVAKRRDNQINKWQMPQGGVDEGETFLEAMKRELEEETSITNIEIIKEIRYWLEYDLPKNLVGKIWKGKYKGQRQRWFLIKFLGPDSEINLNQKCPEFNEWKWVGIDELSKLIVPFKKKLYLSVIKEFQSFI